MTDATSETFSPVIAPSKSTSDQKDNSSDSSRKSRKKSAGKAKGKKIVAGLLKRVINPVHLYRAAKLQHGRKKHRHAYDDAQLALYAKVLPSDFLHFGYFDDPTRQPEDVSLSEVVRGSRDTRNNCSTCWVIRQLPCLTSAAEWAGSAGCSRRGGILPLR